MNNGAYGYSLQESPISYLGMVLIVGWISFFFALKSGNTFCIPLMSSKVPSHSNRAQWDDMAAVPVHESSLLCSM